MQKQKLRQRISQRQRIRQKYKTETGSRRANLALQVDGPLLREYSLQWLKEDRLLVVAGNDQLDGGGCDAVAVVIAGHTLPLTLKTQQRKSQTMISLTLFLHLSQLPLPPELSCSFPLTFITQEVLIEAQEISRKSRNMESYSPFSFNFRGMQVYMDIIQLFKIVNNYLKDSFYLQFVRKDKQKQL